MEQMYTSYWIVVTWWRDWVITWHVGWGLLILVTTRLSFWALFLVKVKIKYFWFFTWRCGWASLILNHHPAKRYNVFYLSRGHKIDVYSWLFRWGLFILSQHPAKFGVHRSCETGNMAFVISVPIPVPILMQGSNTEVYKWPSLSLLVKYTANYNQFIKMIDWNWLYLIVSLPSIQKTISFN